MHVNLEIPLTSSSVQEELLSYIEEHPNAADTAEGIRQWWLIKRISDYSKDIIQTSLDQLVATHSLKKQTHGNGNVVYQLNRQ